MESVAMKAAGGGKLGGRLDDAGNDHGDDEIALTTGSRVEDGIQFQVAQATEDGGDMAVRKGAGDAEGIGQRRGGGRWIASQGRAESCNLLGGEMSEVSEGARFEFAVLAIGLAGENGGGGFWVWAGGGVHGSI